MNTTRTDVLDIEPSERRATTARPTPASVPLWTGAALGVLTFLAYLPGRGRSLDFDSAQTVGMFVRPGPPWAAFQLQAAFNNHPFFSFLEQLVRVVTGRTDAATMRLLPILFGAVAVGVLTWFATRRHGLAAGLVAGGLLACNPTFVTLSRGVRGYSLLVLCAIVATVLVAEDRPDRSRWADLAYVAFAGIGLATHLYMFPVVVAHVGAVIARGRLDARWRLRFAFVGALAALAYVGMAATLVDSMGAYSRVLKTGLPGQVFVMATGGGWASLAVGPLVVVGAILLLRRSRASRGAAAALIGVLLLQWAGLQTSALTARFYVWLVPAAAYLAAVAVARFRAVAVLGGIAVALALAVVVPGFTDSPTAYPEAAALIRQANATGARSCVIDIGVAPMLAYLDSPGDFATITDPTGFDRCDVVVVAAWWAEPADWYARDRLLLAQAEQRFDHRLVLPYGDPILVLSNRVLPEAGAPTG
ncbi:MAG: glycosyltransferase family 39 protein [Acidimicrobiales bacterium]